MNRTVSNPRFVLPTTVVAVIAITVALLVLCAARSSARAAGSHQAGVAAAAVVRDAGASGASIQDGPPWGR